MRGISNYKLPDWSIRVRKLVKLVNDGFTLPSNKRIDYNETSSPRFFKESKCLAVDRI